MPFHLSLKKQVGWPETQVRVTNQNSPEKKIVPQLCVMVNLFAIANSNTNYKSIVDQSPC